MNVYIRSTANISPQKTFGESYPPDAAVEYIGNRLNCIEPDYAKLIDAKLIRRMSRIIKMGAVSAMTCLQKTGLNMPDGITTGTAYGCLEDTSVFLTRLIENEEEMLTPTAFIQSTHNTVGAQIALMIKCHHYNNTFVHRGFSFESALLDAMLLLRENHITHVLAGAVDEITDNSHAILTRLGLYKRKPVSNFSLLQSDSKGTMAGEGAAFFLLTNRSFPDNCAQLNAMHTFYKPHGIAEIQKNIISFLGEQLIDINNIDLIITGKNGDKKGDEIYKQLEHSIFTNHRTMHYKHLCGEYPTASAFALWLATSIVKEGIIPAWIENTDSNQPAAKRVLIYNHYENIYHSLFLISAC